MPAFLLALTLALSPGQEPAESGVLPWMPIAAPGNWEAQTGPQGDRPWRDLDGISWYWTAFDLPAGWDPAENRLDLGAIDDADETFLDGVKLGGLGGMVSGGATAWNRARSYPVPARSLEPGQRHVLAVRVYDSGGNGGMGAGPLRLLGRNGVLELDGTWMFHPGELEEPETLMAASWPARRLAAQQARLAAARGILLPGRLGTQVTGAGAPPPEFADGAHALWYRQPAARWTEALPVGNGRLGAMVHGGVVHERIQLNEDSVWAGAPAERRNPAAGPAALAEARALFFAGDVVAGQEFMQERFLSERLVRSYQTLGDLLLDFPAGAQARDYARGLDLHRALASARWRTGGVLHTRDVFASAADQVLVVRIEAEDQGLLAGGVALAREILPPGSLRSDQETGRIEMTGRAVNGEHAGVRFAVVLQVLPDAAADAAQNDPRQLALREGSVAVAARGGVTILVGAATDYDGGDPLAKARADVERAGARPYQELFDRHQDSYRPLYERCALQLPATQLAKLPTDERLARRKSPSLEEGGEENAALADAALEALYFHYGRYLLISSSRPGSLPANLQGLWNEHVAAPWNADYHVNVNLQMNYWPALVTNLAECQEPVFTLLDGIARRGAETARKLYGARGWVCHHTTDAWWFTVPTGRTVWGL
ncbi:MAG TPA: glycoside hydrolase family 95 protein, partial [Planctomycetota bacterium]